MIVFLKRSLKIKGEIVKILAKNLSKLPIPEGKARMITYSNGGMAYIFKNKSSRIQHKQNKRLGFPPVNRSEPMRTTAFKQTLNKYFIKLLDLDLQEEFCLSLTLTIRNKKYNSFRKISDRFKHFTNCVRFHKEVGISYLGAVRFIEIQEKGFFHIHCILVFSESNIKLTWKDLHRMWGWGYVKVKHIYYFIGLIDYLTNPKNGAKNQIDSKFTKYPKSARVIYMCPNLPKAKSKFIELNSKQYLDLIGDKNSIGHAKFHKWYDEKTQKMRMRIDKSVLLKLPPEKEVNKSY